MIKFSLKDVERNENDRKTYFSMWHVLVSSNVKTENTQVREEIAESLKQAVVYAFKDNGESVFKVLKEGDSFDSVSIENVKISYAAEVGEDPKGGRVHLHTLVEVEHHTRLQINFGVCNKMIKDKCQELSPHILGAYVNIKWVPTSRPLEHYIGKNPLTTLVTLSDEKR